MRRALRHQTGRVRVLLKLVLDCPPDAAWAGIRTPDGLRRVSAPLMAFESLEAGGFPPVWPEGEHRVAVKALGLVPVGHQVIAISYPEPVGDFRLVRDGGHGESGIFTAVTSWQHTMAVSPDGSGRTLYRDELDFEAGRITALLWPMYWVFWQYRAIRLKTLARSWRG